MRASEIEATVLRRQKQSTALRWAWLAVPLAMGAALTLVELNLLKPPTWALFVLIAAIPVVYIGDNVIQASREKAIRAQREGEMDVLKVCVTLAAEVHRITGIDLEILGVSVWRVYVPGRRGWPQKRHAHCLERVERFRIGPHPAPSDASWTEGKGVIGKCWETKRLVFQDWGSAQRACAGQTSMSESRWNAVTANRRWGFERAEYLGAVNKYAQVLAQPITDRHGAFIGCLSIDIPTAETDLVPIVQENALGAGGVRFAAVEAAQSLRVLI